ncbi:MAG: GAF domain-containing protein, partial [Anaerolineae bacterium]
SRGHRRAGRGPTAASRWLAKLTGAAESISEGDLSARAEVVSTDEIGLLAGTFNNMAQQLGRTLGQLEERVAERTRALQTSAEISSRLSTILEPQKLLLAVVEEIQKAFDYYHVHIYLFDDEKQQLEMAGGTGEAGEAMLAARHTIAKGKGLVGQAAAGNEVVLVSDVTQSPGWLPNPLLPDTKAEIAVPIAIGDDVLGVLDVQQNVIQGLGDEDVSLLQSVANQVAVAVQNARQFDSAQHRAQQEARINAIAQRINNAVTIENVLQIAVEELGQATGVKRASVQLTNPTRIFQPTTAPQNGGNGRHPQPVSSDPGLPE